MAKHAAGVTPWNRSIASGVDLLRNPRYNKGTAFDEDERNYYFLQGLLPPAATPQHLQVKRVMEDLRTLESPLHQYVDMMDLLERNEKLFYRILIDYVEELLPVVYTPTVGEACQKYGIIFRRPHGLYISLKERGRVLDILRNWPEERVKVIVVTDGERILGLGDLGCQGMGIPCGKLNLYTALGGVHPEKCLPVTLDVGTNNQKLLDDPYYIGLRQRRVSGEEYDSLVDEFMTAVQDHFGDKCLVQFEDFANQNAARLLEKYVKTHLVFNDDIQGTAAVALAGLLAALKASGGNLADQIILMHGAGGAGTGIAEIIAKEIGRKSNIPLEQARKKIYLLDSKGLIESSRLDSLPQQSKQNYAHEHEPCADVLSATKSLKPNILIGTSGQRATFSKEVLELMASFNKTPIIFALSNPTSKSECTAEEAYNWTEGRAVFASGSPFDPVEYQGKQILTAQANNAYIFPGVGLGCSISGTVRTHEEFFLEAAAVLANQVTEEHITQGLLYPPLTSIRSISADIAAAVAEKAYDLGMFS
eukprot:TRINITY_DN937_c0_g1_i3.p1 TRINITY_DN937_c0_g1~~TRINITY_DN937_c0_g1_i3.p1  ORF type:complete len:601 (-),score=98.06 TRINITY_DN937_c0_g1_i3:217-1818(-)